MNDMAEDSLREAIRNTRKPDKFLSVESIEAELQDLIDIFNAYTTNKIIEARIEAYKDPLYWIKENKLAREQIVDILESRIAELKAPTHRKEL